MHKRFVALCMVLMLAIAFTGSEHFRPTSISPTTSALVPSKSNFYEKAILLPADSRALIDTIENAQASNPPIQNPFSIPAYDELASSTGVRHLGIVLPHHLVAIVQIQFAYSQLKAYNPDLVILMSPNHQRKPSVPIYTSDQGLLVCDATGKEISRTHFAEHFATDFPRYSTNSRDMSFEHGIGHHLPFIAAQNWSADVLPLVLARNFDSSAEVQLLKDLEQFIANRKYQRILWIGSIDFSHYLPATLANVHDKETISWIASRQFNKIRQSSEAHLDAPAVLSLLLKQFSRASLLWQGNSADVMGSGFSLPGTSYLIYYLSP